MKMTKLIMSLMTVLLSIGIVKAQVTTSAISGIVKLADGKPAAGVRVKAIHEPTGTVYTIVSRKGGLYNINNMNTGGPYTVTFSGGGEKDIVKQGIFLTLGETESVDATYQVEEIRIVGTRSSQKLQTGLTSSFGVRVINTVPNISRSITNVTTLTPQAGGGNSFGGRDGRFNNIQIDGANFNNNFGLRNDPLPGGGNQAISLDAIDEITVNISPFDVRQANFTGAGISATTRKGTNNFEGSFFGFARNQNLVGTKVSGSKVPTVVDFENKTIGGRLGGAIVKNKLFFFINGEYEDRSTPTLIWKASRPGVARDNNTSLTPFDSISKLSNHLATAFGYRTGKFENLDNFSVKNYKVLGRIDWNINKDHTLSVKYNTFANDDDQILNGASNPGAALPFNRWSQNSLSFENSNYAFRNTVQLGGLELRSKFSNNITNQLVVTYTKETAARSSKSTPFPFIDINVGPNFAALGYSSATSNYMSAGFEPFTPDNIVNNNTLVINNNFGISVGKHSITAGFGFEKIDVGNSFYRFGNSYYRFNSLDDFITGKAPNLFAYNYPSNPNEKFVKLNFAQASLYAQDEFSVSNKFKLTYGLRIDRPFFNNSLDSNQSVDRINLRDLDGKNFNMQSGSWPKERISWSPRIGFNWDVEGNKSKILRGGVGLFTGRFPFVWFTNQPSNSFTVNKLFSTTTAGTAPGQLGTFLFNPNTSAYEANIKSLNTTTAITNLAYVDPNFRMPQILRVSAGWDQKLDKDWTLSFDGIYNKDINNLLYYNSNQLQPIGNMFGADNRPVFGATNALRRLNTGLSDAMVLTNTKKGFGMIFTAKIAKRFSNNWDFSVAYTHTIGLDITGNPGATANSAWNGIPSVVGNNNLQMANNDFTTPHRVISYGSYKLNWAKYLSTTFSLVYTAFTQGRFSYTVGGDINTDGISNTDLMFIPSNPLDPTQITFVANGAFSAAQQQTAFANFIEQDKYLSKNKGKYADRNGANFPIYHGLDLRILQDILPFKNNRRRGLQISLEIENFTNFLNQDWGVFKRTTLASSRLLSVASSGSLTAAPTYRLNLVNGALPTTTFEKTVSLGSTYRANLGVRLNF